MADWKKYIQPTLPAKQDGGELERILKEGELLRGKRPSPSGLLGRDAMDAEFRRIPEPAPMGGAAGALLRVAPWLMLLKSTPLNVGEDEELNKLMAPEQKKPDQFPATYQNELPKEPIKIAPPAPIAKEPEAPSAEKPKKPEESLMDKMIREHYQHVKSIDDIRRRNGQ